MYRQLSQLYLETARLCIRPALESDLPSFYDMHSVKEVNTYLPYDTWQDWGDAESWFARVQTRRSEEESEQYVLERKFDDKVIGSCIVFDIIESERSLELGYVLNKEVWGQAYMQETLTDLMSFLAKEVGIRQIRATVDLENHASLKLLAKLAFSKVGEKVEEGSNRLGLFSCQLN